MKVVVKLGGSVMELAPGIVTRLLEYTEDHADASILIVPGGGVFADTVRTISKQCGISDEAAHWMAILAMEQYACYLMDKTGANGTGSIGTMPRGVSILLPYRLLKTADELPHSWDVTSDTIAAWVAKHLDARFVKVTDVDGVLKDGTLMPAVGASELGDLKSSCTDAGLPNFMKANSMDCVIVNGRYPDRVVAAVKGDAVIGTYIKGNI